MELGQVGLLSPASLSPMGSTQSECVQFFFKNNLLYLKITSKNNMYWNGLTPLRFSRNGICLLVMKIEFKMNSGHEEW